MKYIALCLVFLGLLPSQTAAQSLLKNGEIPGDLLITLTTFGGWFGARSEMTINAAGDISYRSEGGLRVQRSALLPKNVPAKITKPKVTAERLKFLIGEFEKIQFLRFGEGFPVEDNKEVVFITDQPTETISIVANGHAKDVSNYLGQTLRRTALLYNLAVKIRGAGIWYLPDGEIPENFHVEYGKTTGDKIVWKFGIDSHGRITESVFSYRPLQDKGKGPSLSVKSSIVGKLSKKQLIGLIGEFEKIGFSIFKFSPLTKDSGCANDPGSDPEKRVHIDIRINQAPQMSVSLYENCGPRPETEAAKFERSARFIENLIETVKK